MDEIIDQIRELRSDLREINQTLNVISIEMRISNAPIEYRNTLRNLLILSESMRWYAKFELKEGSYSKKEFTRLCDERHQLLTKHPHLNQYL